MKKITNQWQTVVLATLIITALVFLVSVFIRPMFKSETVIIVACQKNTAEGCSVESAEFLASLAKNASRSTVFFNELKNAPVSFDKIIPTEPQDARAYWEKRIAVSDKNGILKITTLDSSRQGAGNLMSAYLKILPVRLSEIMGRNIELKIVDGPVNFSAPASPNVFFNTLIGLLVGIIFSLILVWLRGNEFERWPSYKPEKPERAPERTKEWIEKSLKSQLRQPKQKEKFSYMEEEEVYPIVRKVEAIDELPVKTKETEKEIPIFTQPPKTADLPKPEPKEKLKPEVKKEQKQEPVNYDPARAVRKAMKKQEEIAAKIEARTKESQVKEEVKIVKPQPELEKPEVITAAEKKAGAPDNLPIFDGEEVDVWKKPVSEPMVKKELSIEKVELEATVGAEKKPESAVSFGKKKEEKPETVEHIGPTEEEIKERLNKLLRGEL